MHDKGFLLYSALYRRYRAVLINANDNFAPVAVAA